MLIIYILYTNNCIDRIGAGYSVCTVCDVCAYRIGAIGQRDCRYEERETEGYREREVERKGEE